MKQMTLQRSLFVSISIHVLLFGTAIAFAGYTGGVLWGRHDTTISVALVGSDSLPGSTRAANHVVQQQKRLQPLSPRETSMPPLESSRSEAAGTSAEQALMQIDEGRAIIQQADTAGNAESTGQSSGAQFGMIPPGPLAAIEAALDRAKVYPRLARERGIQGVVHVRFKLRPSGEVERIEIAKSSGYDILDNASIKAVYRACPMPYLEGWLNKPMTYMLK